MDLISFCKTKKPAKTLMCEFMNGTCITVPFYAISKKVMPFWKIANVMAISEVFDDF